MRSNTEKKEYVHPEATFVEFVYSSVVCGSLEAGAEVLLNEEKSIFGNPWQFPESSDEEQSNY